MIDYFFKPEVAQALVAEGMAYDDPRWFSYGSEVQIKKACNNWNAFPPTTYKVFEYLTSDVFCATLAQYIGLFPLYPDAGLHGGGWHAHQNSGILNPHLDYSLHPKLGLQRKLNLIVYLTPGMHETYGGHLGLYTGNSKAPGVLQREIAPLYNRAVLFDTTKNSWHGMSSELKMPADWARRSLAVYYLTDPDGADPSRQRAKFATVDR